MYCIYTANALLEVDRFVRDGNSVDGIASRMITVYSYIYSHVRHYLSLLQTRVSTNLLRLYLLLVFQLSILGLTSKWKTHLSLSRATK